MTQINDLKMPSTDPRARLTVPDSAQILKRFYFLEREMVLMQAGWLPGTEHWHSKLLLPEFLWQDSISARELRERVLELRYPERQIDVAPDEKLMSLWRSFRDAPNSLAFIESLYTVLKPALRKAFQSYLDMADQLDDGPTVRILRQGVDDLDEQIARGTQALDDAKNYHDDAVRQVASKWIDGLRPVVARLAELLVQEELGELPDFDPAAFGGKKFEIARHGVRDKRFNLVRFAWPDRLAPSRGPGEGFQLQLRQAVHHVNEIWAAEMAGACLFDLTEGADPEFLTDAARWCYDEIRHCRMGFTRLLKWGFELSEMPLDAFSYNAGADSDAVTRLGIIFYFESTYIHTKWQRTKIFKEFGDNVSSHDMDFDWADEQIHAHYGTRWLKYFLEKANDTRRPIDFRAQSETRVKAMQASAGPEDVEATERAFEKVLTRAKQLAIGTK